jgi:cell division protein FtsL
MLAVTAILTAVGVARVHMRTRVLELGAKISDLTADQARLLDHRRRLEAERAYLRNPERVLEVARDQLHMVPIRPERVQRIKLLRGERSE